MSYVYTDDAAHPGATSDGPHASCVLRQIRTNAAWAWDERGVRCGQRFHLPVRIWSPWLTGYGPFFVHTSELYDEIDVHVYLTAVSWSTGAGDTPAGGSDAIYLAASTVSPDGRISMPPRDLGDWDALCDATLPLTTTATDQIVTLTCPVGAKTGWIGVILWCVSVVSATAESAGGVVSANIMPDTIVVPTAPGYTSNPSERAVSTGGPELKAPGATYKDTGSLVILGAYESNGGVHQLTTIPPIRDAIGAYVSYFTLGVAEISGISFEAKPHSYLGPGAGAMSIGQPAEEDSMTALVTSVSHLARTRVPTWNCGEGQHVDSLVWLWWSIYDEANTGQYDYLTDTYRCIHEAVIAQPPPSADRVGYRAIVALRADGSTEAGRDDAQITVKLSCSEIADSTPTEYCYAEETYDLIVQPRHSATSWIPIAQNVWWGQSMMTRLSEEFAGRGMLIDADAAGIGASISDLRRIQYLVVELDELQVTYPCICKISVKRDAGYRNTTTVAVLGAAIASKEL